MANDCYYSPAVDHVFAGMMGQGFTTLSLVVDEVGPMGGNDVVYERSHFTFSKKDTSMKLEGK